MTNLKNKILNFLFPKTCINCGKTGEYLCIDCKKILTTHPEVCPYCHKTSSNYQTCLDCKISPYNVLEWVIIPFSYTDITKKLITNFKYKHQKDIWDFFADRLILTLQTNHKLNIIINNDLKKTWWLLLSYIPTHRYRKHFIKWYNQSEVLARIISQKIQIPTIDLLQKPQATKAQAKLQRNQRLVNLQWKFTLNSEIQLKNNETIILIDDISTTNSTLNEAARTIKLQYPHTKIRWLVIARHN